MKKVTNMFELIYGDPITASIASYKSDLLVAIVEESRLRGASQKELASIIGVSQPRVSDLFNAKLSKFSVEMLLGFTIKIGLNPKLDLELPSKMKKAE